MKQVILEFVRRGMIACGFGPLILVVLYLILHQKCDLQTLTVEQVCVAILSLSALAFIAGGMNVIYQIEQLPLMIAILLHGGTLYIGYLITYLVNGWIETGKSPIIVFTVIFLLGYLVIWLIIWTVTKKNADRLNEKLKEKQHRKSI